MVIYYNHGSHRLIREAEGFSHSKEMLAMLDALMPILFVVAYFVLMRWVLPRLGIAT